MNEEAGSHILVIDNSNETVNPASFPSVVGPHRPPTRPPLQQRWANLRATIRHGTHEASSGVLRRLQNFRNWTRPPLQQRWADLRATLRHDRDNQRILRDMQNFRNWTIRNWNWTYMLYFVLVFVLFLWFCSPTSGQSWRRHVREGFRTWLGGRELREQAERNRQYVLEAFVPIADVLNPRVVFYD
ncbi:hypothetical protein FKW77_000843 [Venturia effusa]|uniref:Transmembrane protein n=1 Tax=Venturia effusa TaxID=50376 RepID=A0A517LRE4_9PEZI|nr:hypothetical protein FKW77_000843 [Venturia effusa]